MDGKIDNSARREREGQSLHLGVMGVTIAELCAAAAGPVADWNVPAEEGCTVLYQAALLLNTASVDEAAQIKAAIRGALRAGAKVREWIPPRKHGYRALQDEVAD